MGQTSRLEFLYYLTRPAQSVVGFHRHACHELVYYLSGSGQTHIDSINYVYRQGTFAVITPHTPHDERHTEGTDVLFIGFRCGSTPVPLENRLYEDTPHHAILRTLQRLKAEMLEKKAFYEAKLDIILQELIIEIARTASANTDIQRNFSHIEGFLLENFAHPVDFHTLAELTGYSYHRFRHLFKEVYGVSPYNYILKLRLQNAGRLLRTTSHSVSRIAQENAFSSESQFCNMFRRAYGCTPREYRKGADEDAAQKGEGVH